MKGGAEQSDGTDQSCIFILLKWECDVGIHQGVLQNLDHNEEDKRVQGREEVFCCWVVKEGGNKERARWEVDEE